MTPKAVPSFQDVEERPMMFLPDDSFELLKTLVDEPDNASFELALNNEAMTLTWYRHFQRNGGLNKILRRQTFRYHYGSKVPAVTITAFITILEQNR
jgi:hypothetical protein